MSSSHPWCKPDQDEITIFRPMINISSWPGSSHFTLGKINIHQDTQKPAEKPAQDGFIWGQESGKSSPFWDWCENSYTIPQQQENFGNWQMIKLQYLTINIENSYLTNKPTISALSVSLQDLQNLCKPLGFSLLTSELHELKDWTSCRFFFLVGLKKLLKTSVRGELTNTRCWF